MKLRYMWIFTISIHLKGIIQKNKIKQKAKRPKLSFLSPLFEFPTVSKEPNKIQMYPFELHKIQRERQLHSEMLHKLMWVWSYTIKQAIYQTNCEQLFETLKFYY